MGEQVLPFNKQIFVLNYSGMIENQNHTHNSQRERDPTSIKLNASYFTSTSSQLFLMKKLSLNSCSSSVSIYQQEPKSNFIEQRKLMMKLLHSRSKNEQFQILQQMQNFYKNILHNQKTSTEKQESPSNKLTPAFCSFGPSYEKIDKDILNYFFSSYLQYMDYKNEKNKKHILSRAKLIYKLEDLPRVVQFYQTFGHGFLNEENRFDLLKNTCLNGWQYFIQQMSKIVVHKKQGNTQNYQK